MLALHPRQRVCGPADPARHSDPSTGAGGAVAKELATCALPQVQRRLDAVIPQELQAAADPMAALTVAQAQADARLGSTAT